MTCWKHKKRGEEDAVRGGLTPLSGIVKLLIHLVRGILHLSGKSQGKVRDRNFKNLWLRQPWLKSHQTSIHLKKALNTFRILVSSTLLRDSVIRGFEDEDYCDHRTKETQRSKTTIRDIRTWVNWIDVLPRTQARSSRFVSDSRAIGAILVGITGKAKKKKTFFTLTLPSVLCVNAKRSHGPFHDTRWSLAEVAFSVFQTLETPRNEANRCRLPFPSP